jgi:hypothetical protein
MKVHLPYAAKDNPHEDDDEDEGEELPALPPGHAISPEELFDGDALEATPQLRLAKKSSR